ncbi:hypothetical protein SALBM217S_09531 [Streptomyces griseoloalbus]
MVKSTWEWPNRRSSPARSAATSDSGRPEKRTCLISSNAASAAAPAAASRSSSAASFTARSIGSASVRATYEVSGSALEGQEVQRPGVVADAEPPPGVQEGGGEGVGVLAVGPVAQGEGGRAGGPPGVRGLEGGDDELGWPAAGRGPAG